MPKGDKLIQTSVHATDFSSDLLPKLTRDYDHDSMNTSCLSS